MTEKTRAYWRCWAPVAGVGVGLVGAAARGGGVVGLAVAAVVAVATAAALWLAWVVDDAGRTARVRARMERRQR